MTAPLPKPQPQEWLRAYAQIQVATDQQILAVLADATDELRAEIMRIVSISSPTISEGIRYQQMATVRKALLENQARVLRQAGRIIEARRLEATARAIHLGNSIDAYFLSRVGRDALAREVLSGMTFGLSQTADIALARMGYSYTALAQHIYNNDVWLGSRIDTRISSILAQGKSAREFAAEAVDWFNPNTPGGVRYAAMRLARSEINNAFHAVSVQQAQDKPWVNAMRWNLSGSHPHADVCDDYATGDHSNLGAGFFKKEDVPRKPHPHCYCYVTAGLIDENDFLDQLTSGGYDDWIAQQRAIAADPEVSVPPVRPTPARTPLPTRASRPTAATQPITRSGTMKQFQIDAAKRMYGDFTRDVRLLNGMRVPDLRALAKHYGLEGAAGQTRPILLRRLKAKLSRV